ncbi:MAG: hypothetical protein VX265_04190 [Myxococcota bacterium]|nr:hypothetical protein [Myxococcota bacterium]MEC8422554.1 hypothetical protein [Myxococcota bacterium]
MLAARSWNAADAHPPVLPVLWCTPVLPGWRGLGPMPVLRHGDASRWAVRPLRGLRRDEAGCTVRQHAGGLPAGAPGLAQRGRLHAGRHSRAGASDGAHRAVPAGMAAVGRAARRLHGIGWL